MCPISSKEETISRHYRVLKARIAGASLAKVAESIGVSPGRVRQIECRSLRIMRDHATRQAAEALHEYQRAVFFAGQHKTADEQESDRIELQKKDRLKQQEQERVRRQQSQMAALIAGAHHRDALRNEVCKIIIDLNRYASVTGDKRFHENMIALSFALTADDRATKARIENEESEIRTRLDNVIAAAAGIAAIETEIV